MRAINKPASVTTKNYQNSITVWSVHQDLHVQSVRLQQALDETNSWCTYLGLTLSPNKTALLTVANAWGRRRLATSPIRLSVQGTPIPTASTLRVLGLDITATGSAKPWIRSAKHQASQSLHLFRRMSQKAGGAASKMARMLVRAILQPRIVYQAQFHFLTKSDWALLESINNSAMRAITGLPALTPVPILQQEAQLNTFDELVHQRRQARLQKQALDPDSAALAAYMTGSPAPPLSNTNIRPPWKFHQLTDTRPVARIHPRTVGAPIPPSMEIGSPSSTLMFVDASASDTLLHTALLCPTVAPDPVTCTYITTEKWPSTQAELLAVRDALLHTSLLINHASPQCTIYTDSSAAVRELRKTLTSNELLLEIQDIMDTYPCRVRVSWRQRNSHPAMQAADAGTHPVRVQYPAPLAPSSNGVRLASAKERLRRTARALIPPCGTELPSGLSRQDEVLLRRLRLGVALTPAVTRSWPPQYHAPFNSTCPFCPAPVDQATAEHLVWSCPALRSLRDVHIATCGPRPGRPPDFMAWIQGPHHGPLLRFLRESGVYLYI